MTNSGNIIGLPVSDNFTVMQALDSAKQLAESNNLQDVLVIGYDAEGRLILRNSKMDRKSAFWMIEQLRKHILDLE
jgi:hypothetical protein